jgi:hypothetical protein
MWWNTNTNANGHSHGNANGNADSDTDSASYANPECTTSADARTQRDASGHAAASTLVGGP